MCCHTFIMSKVHSAPPGLGCMTFHLSAVYSAPYVFKLIQPKKLRVNN